MPKLRASNGKPIMISNGSHVSVTELGRRDTDAKYFPQRPKLLPNKISGPLCQWTPDVSIDASQASTVEVIIMT
jgi:hypothetical protein